MDTAKLEKVGLLLGGVGIGLALSWLTSKAQGGGAPAKTEGEESAQAVAQAVGGGFLCNILAVGVKLDLFTGLWNCQQREGRGVTSEQLAEWCGVNERLLREWLGCVVSARVVQYEVNKSGEVRYRLPEATSKVLCPYGEGLPGGPMSMVGPLSAHITLCHRLRRLAKSFQTGCGLTYDEGDEEGELADGIRNMHCHVFNHVVPYDLLHAFDKHCPSYGGVVKALEAGAKVADVGCGAGGLVLVLAKAFPKSTFTGFDISLKALEEAREAAKKSGLTNVSFVDNLVEPMGEGGNAQAFDLIVSYDLVHDCSHPEYVIAQIARGLKPSGAWLVCDIVCGEDHVDNLKKTDPITWSFSVQLCLPSGMGKDGEGLGLGTVGLSDKVAEKLFQANGFGEVKPFRVESLPMNSCFIGLPLKGEQGRGKGGF